MTKKYSIKFIALNAKDGDVIIYARLIVNRKKVEFSTNIRGNLSAWNEDTQRFVENTNYNRSLNHQLSCVSDRIEDTFRSIAATGVQPNAILIKNVFRGNVNLHYQPLLLDFIQAHIEFIRKQPETYRLGTIIHYTALLKRLENFLKQRREEKILLKDFKSKNIIEFKEFLLTSIHESLGRPMNPSTSGKYLAKLKVIMGNALAKELITHDPFKGVKINRVQNDAEWLTREELDRLIKVDLSTNESLHRVRLMFLFSVYTGLRYSDAFRLRREDVRLTEEGYYRIELKMQKTNKHFDRRMLPEAVALYLEMIKHYPNIKTVLPTLSNQKMNEYLKVIANLAGIKKSISHHTARHTFATTIMLENGADIKLVSHMLGHRSIKVTESIYARYTRKAEDEGINNFLNRRSKNKKANKVIDDLKALTKNISVN
ncbi:MAG: tyrosine-type recombinase/integrase [Bacteroidia bacterium]